MLDAIGSGERFQRGDVIGADAHDLGARGFELGEVRLEAADLARSDGAEGLDDRVDDDRPLAQELAELHRLVPGPVTVKSGAFCPISSAALPWP